MKDLEGDVYVESAILTRTTEEKGEEGEHDGKFNETTAQSDYFQGSWPDFFAPFELNIVHVIRKPQNIEGALFVPLIEKSRNGK